MTSRNPVQDEARRPSDTGPVLSEGEFRRIAAILYEDSGIHLPEGKSSLVYSRLAKRLRLLGLNSFRDYCALVTSRDGLDERQAMLSALTTNHTRFFREPHHFEELSRQLAGGWVDAVKCGGRLRIWSAGCSSGEEPYSIALTVLQALPDAARYDVRILATDIDPVIVDRARAGVYPAETVEPIDRALRDRWMERPSGRDYTMGDEVRELVAFRELNLMTDWPMRGSFQAIFCRNVAIYFEEPTQARLWGRFLPLLAPGGRLFIGHSERVNDSRFETAGLTTYKAAGGN